MMTERLLTFLENGSVQPGTIFLTDFSSQRAELGRVPHLGSGRPGFHPQLSPGVLTLSEPRNVLRSQTAHIKLSARCLAHSQCSVYGTALSASPN